MTQRYRIFAAFQALHIRSTIQCVLAMGICLLAVGCASPVIRSQVTAFHEWPADLPDKSFTFKRTTNQKNNLEYRNYEQLGRAGRRRRGGAEAARAGAARRGGAGRGTGN